MDKNKLQSALVAAVQKLKGEGIIKVNDEVASALKMSKGTFSAYLNGHQTPSKNFVLKFRNLYGIDLEGTKIPATIKVRPGDEYQKLIRLEATVEVLLGMVAEVLARQMNVPVGGILSSAKTTVHDQVKAILNESELQR